MKVGLCAVSLLFGAILLTGCTGDQAAAPIDPVMTTSASGLWVGSAGSSAELEIQEGGFIKISRNGSEQVGTWKAAGQGSIEATFDGQSHTLPFTRKDLELTITLPGDSTATQFTQM